MRRRTLAFRAAVLTVLFFTSLAAPAQQPDTELLNENTHVQVAIRRGEQLAELDTTPMPFS